MKLIAANCLSFIEKIKDCTVNCIITSPPYNLKKNYSKYEDNLPYKEYLDWMQQVAGSFHRILKEDGHLFLNVGYTNKEPWIAFDVAQEFRKHFILQNNIIWVKHIKIGEDTHGIYKPINSNRYTTTTNENIFHFTKTGKSIVDRTAISGEYGFKKGRYEKAYTSEACKKRYISAAKRSVCKKLYGHNNWRQDSVYNNSFFKEKVEEYLREKPFVYNKAKDEGNSWYIPYTPIARLAKELDTTLGNNKAGKNDHPAIFPVELAERCLKFASYRKNWKVLDPFTGTGSTIVACEKLNIKRSLGIDIDENYIDFSKRRIKIFRKKKR